MEHHVLSKITLSSLPEIPHNRSESKNIWSAMCGNMKINIMDIGTETIMKIQTF